MKQMICLGVPILAVGMLLSGGAWGQSYNLPPGVRVGIQRAQDYHGTGRASFTGLKVGQSARATGMGDAYTAVSDDIDAIFWNAAGLTHVEQFEYAAGYTRWLAESKFLSGALAWRYGQQSFGVSFIQFDAGDFQETTPQDPQGTFGRKFHGGDIFLNVAYAHKMTNKLSLGVSAKWIQETLDRDKVNSMSFDFSSIFYTGFGSSRIAMTLRNFGKDQQLLIPGSIDFSNVAQPLIFTIAAAMEAIGRKGDPYSLTVAAEMTHHIDDRARYNLGTELWLANTLALRAGYRLRYDLGDWSVGAGVQRRMSAGRRIGVDFSYVNFGKLFDAPLRVSLTGAF